MGDPLANLNAVMNWEIFQPVLDGIPGDEPKGAGGRPPFHPMFISRILVIQSLYGLHDEQAQFQILDRRSFARFLGITDADTVPDQSTIREFREKLTNASLFGKLFAAFDAFLAERGFTTGTVVTDASVHDSQALDSLTAGGDPPTWLDAGYAGEPCAGILRAKGIEGNVCEKGARNKPLTKSQKRANFRLFADFYGESGFRPVVGQGSY